MDQPKVLEKMHNLDMRFQSNTYQSELVVKDEEARRLRLRIVLLRDENATLKDQATQKEGRIVQLASQGDDVRMQLNSASEKCREQEKLLRIHAREQSSLKTELLSLNGVTQDSAKLLSEKLALSRELALMKPEVEHLRSQLAHQKDVLTEKLALERQLNALEVELANEKRALHRSLQRQESQDNEVEDELRQQVQDLEKKLASEKRAAQRAKESQEKNGEVEELLRSKVQELETELASERRSAQRAKTDEPNKADATTDGLRKKIQAVEKQLENEKIARQRDQKESERQLAAVEEQKELMGQRLVDIKSKLREAREEAKSLRAGVMEAQRRPAADHQPKKPTSKPQKRLAIEMSDDEMALHTPKNIDARPKRPLKKRALEHTLVGEKSAFSITPFLSKTINFAEHPIEFTAGGQPKAAEQDKTTSASEMESVGDSMAEAPASTSVAEPTIQPTPKPKLVAKVPKARGRQPRAKVLGEAPASKKNLKAPPTSRKMTFSEPTLNRVMEEEGDEPSTEQENRSVDSTGSLKKDATMTVNTTAARSSGASTISLEPEPKKKKRKLLGGGNKTVFDDDNETVPVPTTKRVVKPLGPSRVGKGKSTLGGTRNAFAGASFSPLKREKRGVNASFLA